MFSTFKSRLLLGVYVFVVLSIPVGAYLASQTQLFKSNAQEGKTVNTKTTQKPPTATSSAAKSLLEQSAEKSQSSTADTSSDTSSPTIATSFGPTLNLKTTLEGRPSTDQSTKLFVGIVEGILGSNPKFLLSFTVDLPKSGVYSNLSLAGLTSGTTYTALLKGSAQIASSVAFTMSPTITTLNNGEAVNLLTGDLNDDNVVNSADLALAQKQLGTSGSADFNLDGVVNTFDLAIIYRNMDQVGASGAWTSPIPQTASPSASLNTSSQGGYWLWLPK